MKFLNTILEVIGQNITQPNNQTRSVFTNFVETQIFLSSAKNTIRNFAKELKKKKDTKNT